MSDESSRSSSQRQSGRRRASTPAPLRDLGTVARDGRRRRRVPPWVGYGIFAAFLALSGLIGSYAAISLHHRSNINAAAPYHPATHAVVFVLNGYTDAEIRGTSLPNIESLEAGGTTYPNAWSGEFPTSPATLAASLGTGAFPRRNRLIGNEWVDPQTHQVTSPVANDQVLTGSIDQVLEPSNVSSIASVMKARRSSAKVLSVGGSNCSAASGVGTPAADFVVCAARSHDRWGPVEVAGHSLPAGTFTEADRVPAAHGPGIAPRIEGWRLGGQDSWVTRTTISAMRRVHPALTFVTFPEPDVLSQYAVPGDRSRVMNTLLQGIDRNIGQVVEQTRRSKTYSDTVFVIVSTRGFELVSTKVPTSKFKGAVVGTGTLPTYLWGDATALLGIVDASQTQAVAGVIDSERIKSLAAIYYKSRGTYQAQYINPDVPVGVAEAQSYLLGTMVTPASAEVVGAFLPHAGLQGGRLSRLPQTAAGVGLQWANQHGFLLISGHGTFRGQRSSFPARVVDVGPTVEALLGLTPSVSDGNVLADTLFRPPAGAARLQQHVGGRWSRYLNALRTWENRAGS